MTESKSFSRRGLALACAALAVALAPVAGHAAQAPDQAGERRLSGRPIVIGHRGASGYRPEHTLAAYQLAVDLGADFIEPDLVATKDGQLVARHENEISGTTDVGGRPEFEARKATKTIDGVSVTGWFTEDFTLAELKTLRAKERIPDLRPENAVFDGLFEIPTLQEVIDLAKRAGVGIYPETKHPTYFDGIGLSLEEKLVAVLNANGYRGPNAPVFVQSFEVGNLKDLRRLTRVPLVQLLNAGGKPYDFVVSGDPRTYADLATSAGLAEIATYAQGIGPNKNLVIPRDSVNRLLAPSALVADAHRAGLVVHPFTFRNENTFLPEDLRAGNPAHPAYPRAYGDAAAEYRLFYGVGIDGLFSDNADTAVAVRETLSRRPSGFLDAPIFDAIPGPILDAIPPKILDGLPGPVLGGVRGAIDKARSDAEKATQELLARFGQVATQIDQIRRDATTVPVQLAAINDFHGNLERRTRAGTGGATIVDSGGAEFLANRVRQLESTNANTLVVSAGDLIGASPLLSALFHDEPTIEAMNLIGLDYNAVGNHEFDEGATELLRMQEGGCHPVDGCLDGDGFGGAEFGFLAANVVYRDSGDTLFPPYAIESFQGVKVALVGMTLEDTPSIVTPTGIADLEFLDEADTVNALVPELQAQGVQAIVVLLHEGGQPNRADANGCPVTGPIVDIATRMSPAVDAVVSGHTHQAYICTVAGKLVTSAGQFGSMVTDIDLTIDRLTGDVVSKTATNVAVTDEVPGAADVTSLVAKYKPLASERGARVIGTITGDLLRAANAAGESTLGDVIADSQLAATDDPGLGAAQIAFMNPGGVRADLLFASSPAGEGDGQVTYGEAFTVQPFGNSLVTMTLTGAQIETMLEQQWQGQAFPRILHPSEGFTYTWDASKPVGDRVDPATIKLDGVVIDPQASYRVTVNSFLASGGDNFAVLASGTDRLGGAQDLDALEAYLSAAPVSPPPLTRVTRLN